MRELAPGSTSRRQVSTPPLFFLVVASGGVDNKLLSHVTPATARGPYHYLKGKSMQRKQGKPLSMIMNGRYNRENPDEL